MRPAQKAPENRTGTMSGSRNSICFNEAGAKSAGKLLIDGDAPDRETLLQ